MRAYWALFELDPNGLSFFHVFDCAPSMWIYILVPAATAAATANYGRPLRHGGAVVMIPNPRARLVSPLGAGFGIKFLMENRAQQKEYLHYNHTDSCRNVRWTSRFFFCTFRLSLALFDLIFSWLYCESNSVASELCIWLLL